jgi:hypothetical protein
MKKNQLSVSDYYSKMSQFVDDLAASGALLRDAELVAYLLSGMDEAYNPVFTSIVACVDPIIPINRIAATTVHLPLGLSVKFALRLVIPPKPVGIAMMMIPLSLALQASQPQVPLRTRGALIHGQHTILLMILTSWRCMMPTMVMIGFTLLTNQVWILLALVDLLFSLLSVILH